MIGSKVYPYPFHKTTWIRRVFLLVKNLWVIVPGNSWKVTAAYNCFIKAVDRIMYWFTGGIKPHGMLGEQEENL